MVHIRLVKRKDEWHKIYLDETGAALFDKFPKWYLAKIRNGLYLVRHIPKTLKQSKFHREILNYPKSLVDHIDQNTLNNRINNLRVCTKSQNAINSKVVWGKSKYKGVYPTPEKTFRAMIKGKHIGCFKTEELAARAYDTKAKELFGAFAWLNFPDNLPTL